MQVQLNSGYAEVTSVTLSAFPWKRAPGKNIKRIFAWRYRTHKCGRSRYTGAGILLPISQRTRQRGLIHILRKSEYYRDRFRRDLYCAWRKWSQIVIFSVSTHDSVPLQFEFQSRSDRFIGITRVVQLLNEYICMTTATLTVASLYILTTGMTKITFNNTKETFMKCLYKKKKESTLVFMYSCTITIS